MQNPEREPNRDEIGSLITKTLEDALSRLPSKFEGTGDNRYAAMLVVDCGSGSFVRFDSQGGQVQPGEAGINIAWDVPGLLSISPDDELISHFKAVTVEGMRGSPLSELAKRRVDQAIANIRERIREN